MKHMIRFVVSAILSVFILASAYAQDSPNICRGVVVDQKGEPMVGAIVTAKGTTVSVPTDIDGKFSLEVPTNVKKLEISYMGYNVKTVKALPEIGRIKMSRKGLHAGMLGVGASIGISSLSDDDGDIFDYDIDYLKNCVIGVHYQFSTSKRIRFVLAVKYGIPADDISLLDAGLDFNLTVSLGKRFYFYPIVGIGYNQVHLGDSWPRNIPTYIPGGSTEDVGNLFGEVKTNYQSFRISLGIGFEKLLSDRMSVGIEGRSYATNNFSGFNGSAKLTFYLGN